MKDKINFYLFLCFGAFILSGIITYGWYEFWDKLDVWYHLKATRLWTTFIIFIVIGIGISCIFDKKDKDNDIPKRRDDE